MVVWHCSKCFVIYDIRGEQGNFERLPNAWICAECNHNLEDIEREQSEEKILQNENLFDPNGTLEREIEPEGEIEEERKIESGEDLEKQGDREEQEDQEPDGHLEQEEPPEKLLNLKEAYSKFVNSLENEKLLHEFNDLISKGEISNRPDLQFLLEKMVEAYPSIKDLLIVSNFRGWPLKLKEFIIELREFIYRLQKYNSHQEYFPFRFQRDLDKCVPTSLQMVYSSYNIVRDQCELYKEIGREPVKAAKNLIDYGINALLFKVFLPEIPNPDIFKEFFQLYMRLKQSRNLRCIFSIKSINKASEVLQKQLDIQEEDIKHSVVFTGNQEGHHHCPTDGPEQVIKYKTLTGSF